MRKILIFGNSSSGKTPLAKELCNENKLVHLDLDTLAWEATSPPKRKSLIVSEQEIAAFIKSADGWVIEGCYTEFTGNCATRSE